MYPELFEVVVLTANSNWQLLARQARKCKPKNVLISDPLFFEPLRNSLKDLPVEVLSGSVADVVGQADVVVNALVGYSGLAPTIAALKSGKRVALANKESLVVAGELVMRLSEENRAPIIPIDSEHSAILQCLTGEKSKPRRLILTASGGAVRDVPLGSLKNVSVGDVLDHPNWKMGPKITVDSATMVNKGFEVVEARWLFGVDRIDVVIHPQSVVHSMVEFADGAVKAQLGTPDMRTPIAYALGYPERLGLPYEPLDLCGDLSFREVDHARYPALGLVRRCLERGGTACCALNAANEVAVEAFLAQRIGFLDIVPLVEGVLERVGNVHGPALEDYVAINGEAKRLAREMIYGDNC